MAASGTFQLTLVATIGAYIRVAPGQMRNDFFPAKLARYVVGNELKQLVNSGRVIQRDSEFAIRDTTEEDLEREVQLAAERQRAEERRQKREGDITVCCSIDTELDYL